MGKVIVVSIAIIPKKKRKAQARRDPSERSLLASKINNK